MRAAARCTSYGWTRATAGGNTTTSTCVAKATTASWKSVGRTTATTGMKGANGMNGARIGARTGATNAATSIESGTASAGSCASGCLASCQNRSLETFHGFCQRLASLLGLNRTNMVQKLHAMWSFQKYF